ncbi:MAG: hypothetical protein A3A10_00115 [Candidatus Tagabacteria bacterium RIFCSPLOWO2_01_FULL_42_9]|uniref:Uncharacterized protein n=1 Tax=Candidatus Tagabacteria bacterium RIFCSPLOWO2_01_FULL_42_9 TaxID=1802296 RepID=A0A1G2LY51_9BACT|nr:MAG: hypothetical protein A3A10_00115 [Candidatus Tagabacteria bacterium RIFCSPLOWO2_01_FULL_42_9]
MSRTKLLGYEKMADFYHDEWMLFRHAIFENLFPYLDYIIVFLCLFFIPLEIRYAKGVSAKISGFLFLTGFIF